MRIISLCPSLTELVFDLGAGDELVACTKFCVHPADQLQGVERVGGTKNPKVARIIELAPDIVLLNEEENRIEDAEELLRSGVTCNVSFPKDANDTAMMVRDIGTALGREDRAADIAADIDKRAKRVRETNRYSPRVRYAYLIWRDPMMVAAGDTFASRILGLAGGENVFGDNAERYPEITASQLAAANPDVVYLSTEPFPFKETHAAEIAAATGIPRSRMNIVDGEYLTWHGSRTPDGIDYAERVVAAVRKKS